MRKTILIILAVICGISLHAQDSTFNRVVTVERDYQPDIEQATKIKLRPAVLKKEVEPNPVIYSTYSTPLSVEYNLHPLQAAKVSFVPQPILNGVIEGAVGHRNTHLLFGYRINHKKKMSLDLYANHDAYWGKDALSNSKLGMQVNRHFSGADLYFGVEGANEYFSYYGRNFDGGIITTHTPITDQSLWNVKAKIGLRSTNDHAVQYHIQTGYNAFIVPTYTIEHQVHSFLDVAWSNDNHGAGVHVFVQNSLRNDTTGWNKHALRIEPFYSYKNQHIRLHVGVNIDPVTSE